MKEQILYITERMKLEDFESIIDIVKNRKGRFKIIFKSGEYLFEKYFEDRGYREP